MNIPRKKVSLEYCRQWLTDEPELRVLVVSYTRALADLFLPEIPNVGLTRCGLLGIVPSLRMDVVILDELDESAFDERTAHWFRMAVLCRIVRDGEIWTVYPS